MTFVEKQTGSATGENRFTAWVGAAVGAAENAAGKGGRQGRGSVAARYAVQLLRLPDAISWVEVALTKTIDTAGVGVTQYTSCSLNEEWYPRESFLEKGVSETTLWHL